jgi:ubiquinone/menaquinone biosynthesis C-methylase UbiE
LALVYVPDLRPALAELARVVRPGRRVVISDVHPFLVALGWQA